MIMQNTSIHPVIRKHLEAQGLLNDHDIQSFLFPLLSDLPHPTLMHDMHKATDLVIEAILKKHPIYIWGDYDVDGITSAALLYTFFKELGVKAIVHIPDRLTEGYGLNVKKIKELSLDIDGEKLLITVDCGISNHEEIIFAKENGFKVVVTDHHNVPEHQVNADAVLNPKQEGCVFPYKFMAGVGIAFYLAASIKSKLTELNVFPAVNKINMKYFLAFVSVGTVADVMPLDGINRVLVRGGFEVLASDNCPEGLKHLCGILSVNRASVAADSIAFQLGPALNSAGRLGEPFTAFTVLAGSGESCEKAAQSLVSLNKKRKKLCKDDLDIALNILRIGTFKREYSISVLGEFNDGMLGIIASRMVELFNLPVLVFCKDQSAPGFIKGSGRAPLDFNLFRVISLCSRFLKKYGGHSAAAGMTLDEKYFELFSMAFDEASKREINASGEQSKSNLLKDCIELSVSDAINPMLVKNISQLEPLGEANPRPVFVDRRVQFVSKNFFGSSGEHVRGVLRGKYGNVPVLGFSIAEKIQKLDGDEPFSLVYSHMLDGYNNSNTWKLKIHDAWR